MRLLLTAGCLLGGVSAYTGAWTTLLALVAAAAVLIHAPPCPQRSAAAPISPGRSPKGGAGTPKGGHSASSAAVSSDALPPGCGSVPSLGFWQLLLAALFFTARAATASGAGLAGCAAAAASHLVALVAAAELLVALAPPGRTSPTAGSTGSGGAAAELGGAVGSVAGTPRLHRSSSGATSPVFGGTVQAHLKELGPGLASPYYSLKRSASTGAAFMLAGAGGQPSAAATAAAAAAAFVAGPGDGSGRSAAHALLPLLPQVSEGDDLPQDAACIVGVGAGQGSGLGASSHNVHLQHQLQQRQGQGQGLQRSGSTADAALAGTTAGRCSSMPHTKARGAQEGAVDSPWRRAQSARVYAGGAPDGASAPVPAGAGAAASPAPGRSQPPQGAVSPLLGPVGLVDGGGVRAGDSAGAHMYPGVAGTAAVAAGGTAPAAAGGSRRTPAGLHCCSSLNTDPGMTDCGAGAGGRGAAPALALTVGSLSGPHDMSGSGLHALEAGVGPGVAAAASAGLPGCQPGSPHNYVGVEAAGARADTEAAARRVGGTSQQPRPAAGAPLVPVSELLPEGRGTGAAGGGSRYGHGHGRDDSGSGSGSGSCSDGGSEGSEEEDEGEYAGGRWGQGGAGGRAVEASDDDCFSLALDGVGAGGGGGGPGWAEGQLGNGEQAPCAGATRERPGQLSATEGPAAGKTRPAGRQRRSVSPTKRLQLQQRQQLHHSSAVAAAVAAAAAAAAGDLGLCALGGPGATKAAVDAAYGGGYDVADLADLEVGGEERRGREGVCLMGKRCLVAGEVLPACQMTPAYCRHALTRSCPLTARPLSLPPAGPDVPGGGGGGGGSGRPGAPVARTPPHPLT